MQTTKPSPWSLGMQLLNVKPQSLNASYESRCKANTPFLNGTKKGEFRNPRTRCIIQFMYDNRHNPESFPVCAIIKHLKKNKHELHRSTVTSDMYRLVRFTCAVLIRSEIPEYRKDGNIQFEYRFNPEFDERSLPWLKR